MWIRHLTLDSFRCHDHTVVDFVPGVNVIAGPNGSGKTSLLEAAYLLAVGHTFRPGDDQQLVADGASQAIVSGVVAAGGRDVELAIGLGHGPGVGRKDRFRVNGAVRRSVRDFVGHLRAVVFSPDDLDLVKGPPAGRREFLDRVAAAVRPGHARLLSEWERVLRQRNSLLASLPRGSRGAGSEVPETLQTWTEMVVEKGAELTHSRVRTLERLERGFREVSARLGLPSAGVRYRADWTARPAEDVMTVAGDLRDGLAAVAVKERERGLTLVGPHRDDLVLDISGRDGRSRASQGEQRSLALALRLAELRVQEETFDDMPVLLLDDVLSELDEGRQRDLFELLPAAQTLLTVATEDPELAPGLEKAVRDFATRRELDVSVLRTDRVERA
ncbi:MAG: DNA replication and repair protein RecF [Acidimicrobiia bacterium]|nr:DNA replication and repair protein RecF [Acidimicrobiia bacterium]